MCGIVGYVGSTRSFRCCSTGSRRLEYRGYDSAGVAVRRPGPASRSARSAGKLANLEAVLSREPVAAGVGIGHTRWATHGRADRRERAPAPRSRGAGRRSSTTASSRTTSTCKRAAAGGAASSSAPRPTPRSSRTWSDWHLQDDGSLRRRASRRGALARGATDVFALVVISGDEPGPSSPCATGRPLVVGLGDGEYFVASDVPAILRAHARRRVPRGRGGRRAVAADGVDVLDLRRRRRVTRTSQPHRLGPGDGREGRLQALHAQGDPRAAAGHRGHAARPAAMRARRRPRCRRLDLGRRGAGQPSTASCCSRAARASTPRSSAATCIEKLARVPGRGRARERVPLPRARSSTATTSCVADHAVGRDGRHAGGAARGAGARRPRARHRATWSAACHARGRRHVYTHAGPRSASPRPRPSPTQLVRAARCSALRAGASAPARPLDARCARRMLQALVGRCRARSSRRCSATPLRRGRRATLLPALETSSSSAAACTIPIALEGALKLKEISYIHAEGYPAGEMKHGPIALIDENMPVVVIAPARSRATRRCVGNLQEVKARGGTIIAIATEGDDELFDATRPTTCIVRPAGAPTASRRSLDDRAAAAAGVPRRRAARLRRRSAAQPGEERHGRVGGTAFVIRPSAFAPLQHCGHPRHPLTGAVSCAWSPCKLAAVRSSATYGTVAASRSHTIVW